MTPEQSDKLIEIANSYVELEDWYLKLLDEHPDLANMMLVAMNDLEQGAENLIFNTLKEEPNGKSNNPGR